MAVAKSLSAYTLSIPHAVVSEAKEPRSLPDGLNLTEQLAPKRTDGQELRLELEDRYFTVPVCHVIRARRERLFSCRTPSAERTGIAFITRARLSDICAAFVYQASGQMQ